MTRTGSTAILLGALCIGLLAVHAGGQQQQQPQQQPGQAAQGGDVGMPTPYFGPPPPQTRLEAIAAQKGVLITKGYTDVGEAQADDGSRLRVTAVQFTDARQSRESGVVVSVEQRGVDAAVIAYVDADEIAPLAEALDALAKLEGSAGPMANVEGVYRTRGDLEFTNHAINGARAVTARATQILLPSGQVVQASATFRPARLGEIRQLLINAKETLNRPKEEPAGK
jgi:hypothetical protein